MPWWANKSAWEKRGYSDKKITIENIYFILNVVRQTDKREEREEKINKRSTSILLTTVKTTATATTTTTIPLQLLLLLLLILSPAYLHLP